MKRVDSFALKTYQKTEDDDILEDQSVEWWFPQQFTAVAVDIFAKLKAQQENKQDQIRRGNPGCV